MSPAFIKGIGLHLAEQPEEKLAEEETGVITDVELTSAAVDVTLARAGQVSDEV
jgi:hypothetical protein